ncbi:MAG TPA: hypothetical protein VH008_03350 [Pseudonocardia sp.]|jgi:hypothetical protein|nr:hypothetical protein [Pseudonocardia sp.]
MRSRGPIVTLLAVVVLGLVLLAVNLSKSPTAGSAAQAAQAAPAGASQVAAPPDLSSPSAGVQPPAAANPLAPASPPAAGGPNAVADPGAAAAPEAGTAPAPAAAPPAAATEFPATAKYMGYTDGTHAAIAVTVRNGQVSAYLCDGTAIEGWYQGTATNGVVDAKGKGVNALSGTLSGRTLAGTVSARGRSWTYSAAPAAAPAGLYRAKSSTRTTGWIKDSSGKVTGLAHDGDTVTPAGPLDPATAQSVEGGDRVVG